MAQSDVRHKDGWKEAEEEDMLDALGEALVCRKCEISVTEMTMTVDINNGAYITTRYPPFFTNPSRKDDCISPLETDTEHQDPSYWKRASISLRQQYYEQVEQNLNQALAKSESPDPESAVLFAHYQVDYHIQQHYLTRCGVLTLCRDSDDMQALRRWQWEMADVDGKASVKGADSWPTKCRQGEWPNDQNLVMMHQTAMWQQDWRVRQQRVEAARARWAVIMEERRRQREMLKLKQVKTLTLRLYCHGDLWDVREIKRKPDVELSLSRKTTRSSGFRREEGMAEQQI